jgi:hypothetical protein
MATTSAAALSRGPLNILLSSSGAQWAAICGLGAYTILGPDKIIQLLQQQRPSTSSALVPSNHSNAPIVLHVGNSGEKNEKDGVIATVVTYAMGAGAVWVCFAVVSGVLPDQLKRMLPVTRKVFDVATQKLAEGIYNVKDVLGKQILSLIKKQDELGKKQEDTHRDVKEVKSDLKEARSVMAVMTDSIDRCEHSLEQVQRLQAYTARGVKLLVRSVSSMLTTDDRMSKELLEYARDGTMFKLDDATSSSVRMSSPPPTLQPQKKVTPENEHPVRMVSTTPATATTDSLTSDYHYYNKNTSRNSEELNELLAMIRSGRLVVN